MVLENLGLRANLAIEFLLLDSFVTEVAVGVPAVQSRGTSLLAGAALNQFRMPLALFIQISLASNRATTFD